MAGFAGLEWTAIVLAYLLVIVFDVAVSRTGAWPGQGAVRRRTRGRAEETPAAPPAPTELEPRHVRIVPREPDPAAQPELERVPEPEPRPEPGPEPEHEPEAPRVVALTLAGTPREWNVWELERLVRANTGGDVVKDEELSHLLVYLRGFATPEGTLPVDFDELVRESFGPLLVTR